MDKRIAMAVATGAVVALPLLAGCGGGSAPEGGSAAPAASSAAAPSTTAAAPSASATASASASPSSDPAAEKKNADDAAEKFIRTALTIGYPDTSYSAYTKRVKPLMTSHAFASFKEEITADKGEKALKKLSGVRARTTPKIKSSKVTSISATKAVVKISYQNQTQQKTGGDWKTVQAAAASTDDVKLVHEGGDWLVDDLG